MAFTDEQPFLDAISARYAEDGPRLVYADFLDDAGDPPRAELVRVQIALARVPDDHPRKPELVDRQDDLIAAHSAKWTEHLGNLVVSGEFRRGVLDSVVVDAGTFLESGDELFRRARIRRVRMLDAARVVSKLNQSPLLEQVRELDLCANELGNAGLAEFVRSPHLGKLEDLNLADNGLDDSGMQSLAAASSFPSLATLSLNDNERVTSDGAIALAGSPFFAGLTALDLSRDAVHERGVQAIVASRTLARLHTFRVTGNPIGDVGVAALVRSPLLDRMLAHSPRLELRANEIGPDGARLLAASFSLLRCVALDLSGNFIGDRGFSALIDSPNTKSVHTLKLAANQISDAGLVAVRDGLPSLFARLRYLDLSTNRLTRYGLGLLEAARGDRATVIDTSGNVQAAIGGEAPVPVGRVVPEVLRGMSEAADAAELRRRVAHPTRPRDNRPNPNGG